MQRTDSLTTKYAADKLERVNVLLNNASGDMAALDFEAAEVKQNADELLRTLIISDPDISCVWFAFEPDVFSEGGRYYKTLMRIDGIVQEIPDLNDEVLGDPEKSPWYNVPLSTGYVYSDAAGLYNYGLGEGDVRSFTISYPITAEGRIIGCVGLDMTYDSMLHIDNLTVKDTQAVMLISGKGDILYSEYCRDEQLVLENALQNSGEILQVLNKKEIWQGKIESPIFGVQSQVRLYPIRFEMTGETVYLYWDTPTSSVTGEYDSSMNILAVTGGLGILLLGFCVFFTTRGIVRPIKKISDSFRLVADNGAEGTLDGEHVPVYPTNIIEMETLQTSLVSMMMQLRKAHKLRLDVAEADIEKEKLLASAEAKTNFFASMSHEIRTPMNAILGISEILLHEGGLTEMQNKYIQDIKISSDALLLIIDDILDISKLESGKMALRPEHFNFRALIDNIASMGAHLAGEAGLQFIYEAGGELPSCLYGDEVRLRQILFNLIGNAVKFTKEGFVMLRVIVESDTLRFEVVDSGIGIKAREKEVIFDSFKRGGTTRNSEVKGTGLGLAICKNLVEIMGGEISVGSVYGSGSTFAVTIPLVLGDEKKMRHGKIDPGIKYSDSLRLLIVDDNEINLNVSSGLFKSVYGIACDTASSGWEAISKVRKIDYDIVFMDHMMPELDGVEATRRIRQLGEKYEKLPIIALTANAVIGMRQELIDAGLDDYLAKPIQSAKLQEILYKWVPEEKRIIDSAKDNRQAYGAEESAAILSAPERELLTAAEIDFFAGLENIGFDEGMYIQSLRLFRDNIPQIMPLLTDLLEKGNMRDFHTHVHGLKGSLMSIGAAALSEKAEKLEAASSADDISYCRAFLPDLNQSLAHLYEKLCEAVPEGKKAEIKTAFDDAGFKAGLRRLCSALEAYDYEALIKELRDIQAIACSAEISEGISQVQMLIDGFDYQGAADLIMEKWLPYDS